MVFKFYAVQAFCFLGAVCALPDHHGGHSHQSVYLESHGHDHHDDHHHDHDDHHAKYHFDYGVEDKKTGDYKEHSEKRDGDKVTGHYELIDADGHKRTVHYTADKHKGFEATVHYEPIHHKVPQGHKFHGGHAEFKAHDHKGHHHHHESEYSLKQEHAHNWYLIHCFVYISCYF